MASNALSGTEGSGGMSDDWYPSSALTYNNRAGLFEIEVSQPWPCWVTITREDQKIFGLRSDELRDLKYLVDSAVEAAERALHKAGQ